MLTKHRSAGNPARAAKIAPIPKTWPAIAFSGPWKTV
jgi:hypothetical protein